MVGIFLNNENGVRMVTVQRLKQRIRFFFKFNCKVYKKPGKLPKYWKSEIPTKYKRNCVTGRALHRAKRISSDFDSNVNTINNYWMRLSKIS